MPPVYLETPTGHICFSDKAILAELWVLFRTLFMQCGLPYLCSVDCLRPAGSWVLPGSGQAKSMGLAQHAPRMSSVLFLLLSGIRTDSGSHHKPTRLSRDLLCPPPFVAFPSWACRCHPCRCSLLPAISHSDGWTDGLTDRRTDRRTDRWKEGRMEIL